MGDDVIPVKRVTTLGEVLSSLFSGHPKPMDETPTRDFEKQVPIKRDLHPVHSDKKHPKPAYVATKKTDSLEVQLLEAEARVADLRAKTESLHDAREAFRNLENNVEDTVSRQKEKPGSYPEEGAGKYLKEIKAAFEKMGNPNRGLLTDSKVINLETQKQVEESLDKTAKAQALGMFHAGCVNQEKDAIKPYQVKDIDECLDYLGVEKGKRYEFLVNEYKKLPAEQRVPDDKIISKEQYEAALKKAEAEKTSSLPIPNDTARTAAAEVGASADWLKAKSEKALPADLKTGLAMASDLKLT